MILNLQEVCGVARISIRDAHRMLREGNFPIDVIRTGKTTYRFATKKLLEYLDLDKLPDVIPDPPPDTQAEGLKSGALKFWLYRMLYEIGSFLYVWQ
ncbi:hypothetical protein [uncultured Corynebacterium sp.]|uniref:hypothetical protein n=1 Tax=uncultured Corynebacterium sp. TaxID=159447 RepID=UPI0025D060F8|nr:hypothetical protein [uncultured Corynebacterium sp.]